MRHLVVMAAGTGGHVIPGLAVAREMQRRGWTVSWLGTPHGMENRLVPPTGIALDRIAFSGLRGKGLVHALGGASRLFGAMAASLSILRRRSADVVLGMGGYVCLPGGLMAALLRKPLVLVNADAGWLMSNRLLAPLARRIAFGFDSAAARANPRALVTGNPVRDEIDAVPPPAERYAGRSGPLRLLVVGGSLGARVLNNCLPQALALLAAHERPRVVHQTGVASHAEVVDMYARLGLLPAAEGNAGQAAADAPRIDVVPFIDDMARQLADCDLIVCRAGAVTVSELCAAGIASVLVPLVLSTTSHQRDNALHVAGHGAALHLQQAELSPDRLAGLLRSLDREVLQAMATRARALGRPHAAARVADQIEQSLGKATATP